MFILIDFPNSLTKNQPIYCQGVQSGRGPLTASYRAAMTQMTMGGSGVSEANGVLRKHCYLPGEILYKKRFFISKALNLCG